MKTIWIINEYASTPQYGWGGRNFYLAEELAKLGYKVYLIASASNHLLHQQPIFKNEVMFESVSNFTFVWMNLPSYEEAHSRQRVFNWFIFPYRIQKLSKLIKDKPDIVMYSSPSPIGFLGAQRIAKKFSSRLVFEVRDIWPLTLTDVGGYSKKHPFIRFMQWVENKAYRDSDRVVSNLKNSVDHMVQHGLEQNKFTWVPNGFSLNEVKRPEPLSDNTLSMLPKKSFIVGYTGTFGLTNDLYTLIDAAELLKANSSIKFVLVGGGKDKSKLESYISQKKLKNIILIDFIRKQQVQSILSKFDVLAVGAKKEPIYKYGVSPNKLFDYLYSAKPILYHIDSGDYKPITDTMGLISEPENKKELADNILQFYYMTQEKRDEMGENARNMALKEYEYGALVKKLEKVFFDNVP